MTPAKQLPDIPEVITDQKAFCTNCNCHHSIPRAPAAHAAMKLMARMDKELKTSYLYGEALGKMFGILLCRSRTGKLVTLKAFSGQYNGNWELKGWVPPLFNVSAFQQLSFPMEKKIKSLGKMAASLPPDSEKYKALLKQRKLLSQQLMRDIHALYTLHNFRGEQRSLTRFFPKGRGIPTGTGDCCAPKLLNHAAIHNLHPLALVEFYWGMANKSATKHEGHLYQACEEKCGPLLGYLLCGSKELSAP